MADMPIFVQLDAEKFLPHLNGKWRIKICAVCGANKFSISDRLWELRPHNPEGQPLIGPTIGVVPLIHVMCENCGYVYFFNAVQVGISPPATKVMTDAEVPPS